MNGPSSNTMGFRSHSTLPEDISGLWFHQYYVNEGHSDNGLHGLLQSTYNCHRVLAPEALDFTWKTYRATVATTHRPSSQAPDLDDFEMAATFIVVSSVDFCYTISTVLLPPFLSICCLCVYVFMFTSSDAWVGRVTFINSPPPLFFSFFFFLPIWVLYTYVT